MVTVEVIALGKLKEKYWREAMEEYSRRLSRFCHFNVVELAPVSLSENSSQAEIDQALEKESQKISERLDSSALKISLCIEGKMLSSEGLAEYIDEKMGQGKSKIQFIIGSSFGLSPEVKKNSDFKLSFSPMTFPHQMMRVLTSEQIYRAFSILNNGKYHK